MEEQALSLTRKMPYQVIVKAPGLLDMQYKPTELANELGIDVRAIREWTKNGLPHQRDHQGRLWINGRELAKWVNLHRQRPGFTLAANEAYCLRCRRKVKLLQPTISYSVTPPLLRGKCPRCSGDVNRGLKSDLPK